MNWKKSKKNRKTDHWTSLSDELSADWDVPLEEYSHEHANGAESEMVASREATAEPQESTMQDERPIEMEVNDVKEKKSKKPQPSVMPEQKPKRDALSFLTSQLGILAAPIAHEKVSIVTAVDPKVEPQIESPVVESEKEKTVSMTIHVSVEAEMPALEPAVHDETMPKHTLKKANSDFDFGDDEIPQFAFAKPSKTKPPKSQDTKIEDKIGHKMENKSFNDGDHDLASDLFGNMKSAPEKESRSVEKATAVELKKIPNENKTRNKDQSFDEEEGELPVSLWEPRKVASAAPPKNEMPSPGSATRDARLPRPESPKPVRSSQNQMEHDVKETGKMDSDNRETQQISSHSSGRPRRERGGPNRNHERSSERNDKRSDRNEERHVERDNKHSEREDKHFAQNAKRSTPNEFVARDKKDRHVVKENDRTHDRQEREPRKPRDFAVNEKPSHSFAFERDDELDDFVVQETIVHWDSEKSGQPVDRPSRRRQRDKKTDAAKTDHFATPSTREPSAPTRRNATLNNQHDDESDFVPSTSKQRGDRRAPEERPPVSSPTQKITVPSWDDAIKGIIDSNMGRHPNRGERKSGVGRKRR